MNGIMYVTGKYFFKYEFICIEFHQIVNVKFEEKWLTFKLLTYSVL